MNKFNSNDVTTFRWMEPQHRACFVSCNNFVFFKSSSTKFFIIIFPDNTKEANNSTINPLQWRATNKQQKYTIHSFILEVLMAGQYKLAVRMMTEQWGVRRVSAWCVRCPAEAPCQTNLSFWMWERGIVRYAGTQTVLCQETGDRGSFLAVAGH